jgi:glycosyltransferase involved in cell wall biosynthesis
MRFTENVQDTMSIEISAVICTYNRADLLSGALDSLCHQTLASDRYEILVVDNASTDNTAEVVQVCQDNYPDYAIRYFHEAKQGLSYARNRGWQEARGEYVAYIDDDCKVPEQWLTEAIEIIRCVSPGMLGGPYYAFYNSPKPAWYKDEYGSHMVADQAGKLPPDQYLSGGNLFIHKDLLRAAGGFNSLLGMAGKEIAYGEETALIRWVGRYKPQTLIYYSPELFVYHLVRETKWNFVWLIRQRFAQGRFGYLTLSDNQHTVSIRHVLGFFGIIFVILYECTFGVVFRNRRKYPYYQNYLFECAFQKITTWGKLYERLRRNLFRVKTES